MLRAAAADRGGGRRRRGPPVRDRALPRAVTVNVLVDAWALVQLR